MKLPILILAFSSAMSCVKMSGNQQVIDAAFPENVHFTCDELSTSEEFMQRFQISLTAGSTSIVLDTIADCGGINETQYSTYQIVDSSGQILDAAGGWYAGSGDYFYCVRKTNDLLVYQGWQDEMQEDDGFHYKLIKSFTFLK